MDDNRSSYWKVELFPENGENYSPDEYIMALERKDERAAIHRYLLTIEKIKYPRDWPNTKPFEHNNVRFYQSTIGRHRIYLYLDSKKIIVCYACPKKSDKTKQKDKDRVVASIQKYERLRLTK